MQNRIDDPACRDRAEALRTRLMEAAARAGDPLQKCIEKTFGLW